MQFLHLPTQCLCAIPDCCSCLGVLLTTREEQHVPTLINAYKSFLVFPIRSVITHKVQPVQLGRVQCLPMTHSCISRAARGWAAHLPQSSVLPVVVGDGCFVLVLVRMAASPCRRRSAGHWLPCPCNNRTSAIANDPESVTIQVLNTGRLAWEDCVGQSCVHS